MIPAALAGNVLWMGKAQLLMFGLVIARKFLKSHKKEIVILWHNLTTKYPLASVARGIRKILFSRALLVTTQRAEKTTRTF
jgi:hypothetical protein